MDPAFGLTAMWQILAAHIACASTVTLRSAFLDRRVHCNTLTVLAEWPVGALDTATLSYNNQTIIAQVRPVFLERWISHEFPGSFTHRMSFMTAELPCFAPVVPVFFGNFTVPIKGILTKAAQKPRVESCVGVVQSFNNKYVSDWLDNQHQIGVSQVNMYVSHSTPRNSHPLIRSGVKSRWIRMVPWMTASRSSSVINLWSSQRRATIPVGHGDVFYHSQNLALLDCIYSAASRGVTHVISVDMDEMVVANTSLLTGLGRHVPLNRVPYYAFRGTRWPLWHQPKVDRHVKTLMVAADVIDADVHGPMKCVSSPCACANGKCAINNPGVTKSTEWNGMHVAHIQPSRPIRLLVLVLSCKKYRSLWRAKLQLWRDTIILAGDRNLNTEFKLVGHVLWLRCHDTYDGLPMKVALAFRAVLSLPKFESVTHVLKTDDHDNVYSNKDLKQIERNRAIRKYPYVGSHVHRPTGQRRYHFGKVPTDSPWHQKPYTGVYVPWADGGCGYVLRRDALECFRMHTNVTLVYETEIFEDLMVAKALTKCKIKPYLVRSEWIEGDK